MFILEKSDYLKNRTVGSILGGGGINLGTRSNQHITVSILTYKQWKSVKGVGLGSARNEGDALTPSLSNAAQPHRFDGLKEFMYHK